MRSWIGMHSDVEAPPEPDRPVGQAASYRAWLVGLASILGAGWGIWDAASTITDRSIPRLAYFYSHYRADRYAADLDPSRMLTSRIFKDLLTPLGLSLLSVALLGFYGLRAFRTLREVRALDHVEGVARTAALASAICLSFASLASANVGIARAIHDARRLGDMGSLLSHAVDIVPALVGSAAFAYAAYLAVTVRITSRVGWLRRRRP